MKKLALLLASLVLAIATAGCSSSGSPADYPANFRVVAGDGSVIVSWTAEPDVQYWIFWGPGNSITTTNWSTTGGRVIANATSPYVVTGLTNDSTYSFTINARKDGGPGGSGAPTQVAVPRIAGPDWAVGTPMGTATLNGVSGGYGATGYASIAVGAGGTIHTSINSAATTTPTNPSAPADLNAIWYGSVGWVATGANGTVLFTQDGTTWTAQTSNTTAHLYGVSSLSVGGFVAVGAGGTLINSSGGTEWTLNTASGTTSDLYAVTLGTQRFVAVGAGGTIVTSDNGLTWEATPSGTTGDLRGAAYAATSTVVDGVAAILSTYVAVGAGGTILRSTDGLAWTAQASPTTNDLNAVTYGGQFVAVGNAGTILTSPDGVTWTPRTSGTTRDLKAVMRTLSGYTAVGAAGTNVSTF